MISVVPPMAEGLAAAFLVSVLTVFLLVQRESVRDRLLGLAGRRQLTATTRALEDTSRRVSREIQAVLELDAIEPPTVAPPEGVEVVPWSERPQLTRGLYEVYAEATADIPGNVEQVATYEEWLTLHMNCVPLLPPSAVRPTLPCSMHAHARTMFWCSRPSTPKLNGWAISSAIC